MGKFLSHSTFFQDSGLPNVMAVQDFIFVAARLYIFFMSIFGMILLNFFGPRLCVATKDRPQVDTIEGDVKKGEAANEPQAVGDEEGPVDVEAVIENIADVYSVSAGALATAVEQVAIHAKQ